MTDFILPDIGEGIVECELVEWLVAEGDPIVEDQPVADVMTDKALVQIPAMHSGTVTKLYYQKGDIAKVHEPLFAIEIDGQESSSTESKVEAQSAHSDAQASVTGTTVEDFILPDIGEGIVECELVEWLVEEGQEIVEDQPVADVMTDKALVQIPAKYSGKVVKLHYAKGEIAKVHTPLFAIERVLDDGEVTTAPAVVKVSAPSAVDSAVASIDASAQKFADGDFEPPVKIEGRVLASPAVRRLARERNIDLNQLAGSGKKGRVLKADVFSAQTAASAANKGTATTAIANSISPSSDSADDKTVPIRGVQAAMARQMLESVTSIPHFTVSDELDMGALIAARKLLKPEFEKQGLKLSFMPFFIKAMSLALKEFPIINSQVNEDCTELTYKGNHNIGVAVDSKVGLLVPNIKGVQHLSLMEITEQFNGLIDKAREGRLTKQDLSDGTISISNVGAIGGTTATPVINKPEAAIVALGKMQQLPRFDDKGEVFAANIMHVSWSGDHRIIDGATMVRFNNLWMSYLANPMTMLAAMR